MMKAFFSRTLLALVAVIGLAANAPVSYTHLTLPTMCQV